MKVSCIIPAYNEAKRISEVLEVLLTHELIDEVIVTNDASTDNTREILEKIPNIVLINQEKNQGKTLAILAGVKKSKNDIIILIDSDLIGLSLQAITDLLQPVLRNEVDITISLRKNALTIYKILGSDFVSGERVFNKKLILDEEAKLQSLPGFGLEVFINQIIISKNLRLKIVKWNNVISPRKSVKVGFWLGSLGDLRMIAQILSTIPFTKVIYQIYKIRKLSRK